MDTREIGKLVAGAAIYKLQDHYLPQFYSYRMYNMDLAKIGLGVAEVALAYFGERKFSPKTKEFLDVLGVAGITQIVSEIAAGLLSGVTTKATFVPTYVPATYEALPPAPFSLVRVD